MTWPSTNPNPNPTLTLTLTLTLTHTHLLLELQDFELNNAYTLSHTPSQPLMI